MANTTQTLHLAGSDATAPPKAAFRDSFALAYPAGKQLFFFAASSLSRTEFSVLFFFPAMHSVCLDDFEN